MSNKSHMSIQNWPDIEEVYTCLDKNRRQRKSYIYIRRIR